MTHQGIFCECFITKFVSDVWGFDEKAVEVLEKMKPADDFFKKKFEILLQGNENHRFKHEVRPGKLCSSLIHLGLCSFS